MKPVFVLTCFGVLTVRLVKDCVRTINEARWRKKLMLLSAKSDREYADWLERQFFCHRYQRDSVMPQVKELRERANRFEKGAFDGKDSILATTHPSSTEC